MKSVKGWKEKFMIISMMNFKGQLIDEIKTEITEWVYNTRVIRKNKLFLQVFFDVASIYGIRMLTESLEEMISRNK